HNKPLLLAWLIALVSWPFGQVTQVTAVIPSAAAAFATALVIFGAGRDMFGADAGKYAALVAITTQGVFLHGRLPMPDMLLTFFITASLWMLWRMRRGARWAWVGFYTFVGLAFWSKGPGGFLPLAVALAWAVVDRDPVPVGAPDAARARRGVAAPARAGRGAGRGVPASRVIGDDVRRDRPVAPAALPVLPAAGGADRPPGRLVGVGCLGANAGAAD